MAQGIPAALPPESRFQRFPGMKPAGAPSHAVTSVGDRDQEVTLEHKYSVGQNVHLTSGMLGRAAMNGPFRVMRLLPAEGDDFLYRIKSNGEAYERVARESQLERA